jgi:hypothetical protein
MTGEYFSWLSHDDLYETTKVEDQVAFLRSFPNDNVIATCNVRALFASGIKKQGLIDTKAFRYFDIFLATAADVGLNGCTLLIPRKALLESGGFDTNLPVTQDYDLWFRLYHRHGYKFALLPKNLVFYRRHDEQDSVKKQQLTVTAGDALHYEILTTVDYLRFEEYFTEDKSNVKNMWANYQLYKSRNYTKTASMILKNLLRYYYENDRKLFYKAYYTELQTEAGPKNIERMILEYNRLVQSGTNEYPLKTPLTQEDQQPKTRLHRIAKRLQQSIKEDGVYLTGEKLIRKVHARVTRRRK